MKISASTNPPKMEDLFNYVKRLNNEDVDFLHVDIMDGKFVPAKTFDYKLTSKLRAFTSLPFDVHLMTISPQKLIKKYIKAGADILTMHLEAFPNHKSAIKALNRVRKFGAFAGISIKPTTPVEEVFDILPYADLLLVMSVEPGKSGQNFLPQTLSRLEQLNNYLNSQNLTLTIEVDGGVNDQNIADLKSRGVNMVALGNYLYSSKNLSTAIQKIK